MTRRSLVVALTLTIALVAPSGAAGADHADDLLDNVRERFQALQQSLEQIAERATVGELDAAIDVLTDEARPTFQDARDDIADLASQEARLLQAFFDGMATAADDRNADDLTALARSASSTMADVLDVFEAYAEVGTTVEVESAELASNASTTLALFARDVPSGFAGIEVVVRFDPESIRVDEATLETGRGATQVDQGAGAISFNGVAVDLAAQRAPPDVLALGTFQFTAIGDSETEAVLATDIREIVDLDGNRLPALDVDGTVTIR